MSHLWVKVCKFSLFNKSNFIGLALVGKDIVFRFIISI
jgi:hypothetical protein